MTDQPAPAPGSAPAPDPAVPPPTPGTWGQPAPAAPPAGPPATPQVHAQGGWGAPPAGAPPGWGAGVAPAGAPSGWGGGVAPAPRPRGPKGTSGRTSLVVLVIILGVVFGANVVNAALPLPADPGTVDPGPGIPTEPEPTLAPLPTDEPLPGETLTPVRTLPPLESQAPIETAPPVDPGPVQPGEGVDVGGGFVVHPPGGWTAVSSEDGFAVFQKSGVLLIVAGFPWEQSAADLALAYREAWFAGGEFTGDDPEAGTIGNGIPAAGLNYTGVWNGGQVDGAIIAASVNGSGLLVNMVGATGTLGAIGDDLETVLGTVGYTGG